MYLADARAAMEAFKQAFGIDANELTMHPDTWEKCLEELLDITFSSQGTKEDPRPRIMGVPVNRDQQFPKGKILPG